MILRNTLFALLSLTLLSSCEDFFKELINPSVTMRVHGRVVEAFDSTRPVDSVFVEVCLGLLGQECPVSAYTDVDGQFDLSFETRKIQGRSLNYHRDLYGSLDRCDTLADGSLECYLEPYPTQFKIGAQYKKNIPFIYDSATFLIKTTNLEELKSARTEYYIDSNMDTVYYWTFNESKPDEVRYYYWTVEDNSEVNVIADYFQNGKLSRADSASIFCSKGYDTAYFILDE